MYEYRAKIRRVVDGDTVDVDIDLGVMERDAKKMRGDWPTLFCDLKSYKGLDDVVGWIKRECLFEAT